MTRKSNTFERVLQDIHILGVVTLDIILIHSEVALTMTSQGTLEIIVNRSASKQGIVMSG